ncbi:MAG: hypothetical protein U9Q15_05150 [Patescibacteria group bacterium]|nr:hypothetical protein [Patescibacteria group bacterium]
MSEKQNKIPVKTPVNIFTFILGLINQVFSVFFGLFDFTYGTLQVLIRGIHKEDIRHFIINHDEMAWFQVSFIGATLFLSLMYSLGWFIVLVLLHYVLEIARGRILGQGWIRSMKK